MWRSRLIAVQARESAQFVGVGAFASSIMVNGALRRGRRAAAGNVF